LRLLAILFLLLVSHAAFAEPLTVAVASNFRATAEVIAADFTADTGHDVRISSGSTGKLHAQLLHGAPYDVFLSGDTESPRWIEESSLAVSGSRFTYAIGTLVLWSGSAETAACSQALNNLGNAKLAIANPDSAPYGRAAKEFLINAGHWERVSPQLVYGENVAQAMHFAVTENARFAIVAKSQVIDPRLPDTGCSWEIPADSYAPIEQQAVLLQRAADNPAAIDYMQYLQDSKSRATIRQSGYGVP
jgi:molybdate transport system substrate-binding protein